MENQQQQSPAKRGRSLYAGLAVAVLTALWAGAAAAQFAADDFNACQIDPVWSFVDPANDGATALVGGSYTDNAQLLLSVPGGATHEIWNTSIGAPHLIQPVADVDLVAEAKFDSNLPQNFGQEGIVVRQDNSTWLRLEFYRDEVGVTHAVAIGGPTNVFADVALPPGTAAPLYLRVVRVVDTWTLSWSPDGGNWNVVNAPFDYVMQPNGIGVYAGNRGAAPPAHTVHVDYFTNTAGAPAAEDAARNTLTVDLVGGGLVQRTPDLASYACGEPVTLTAIDQPGWVFAGWSGAASGTANPTVVTMDGPQSVTATFVVANQFTLDVTNVGGGSVALTPPGGIYNEGTLVTLNAVDGPGWAFASWSGDLTGTLNPATLTMDANKAVTATFGAVAQYPLATSVVPGGAGSVILNPPGGLYNAGTPVTVTAAADPGWGFDGWSGDLNGSANPQVLVMDAARSVTASFSVLPERTLTVNVTGQGTVLKTPDQPTYLAGASVELTAVPDPGWQFSSWSGDLTGTANPANLVVDVDKVVTAGFTLIPPIIVADDFSVCDLDPVWTVVDPFGDGGTASVVDAYTDSASVAIYVPGGFPHEIWNGVIGATHILQPAQNIDFVVEAKFDSDLPVVFAQEGILIKESETAWVRAEFFRDDQNKLRVAVDLGPAQTTHDIYLPPTAQAPLWMRVARIGDKFVQSWSDDGLAWTVAGDTLNYPMTVTGIALFAGNRGGNPLPHTVRVDYVTNSAGAPAAEDSLRAPLDVAVAGGGLVTRALDLANYGCGQVETLTAVDQPGWVFNGWTGDITSSANPLDVAMAGPFAVTANFVAVPFHALDVLLVGNGSVVLDPPGGLYNVGTTVNLTAVPDSGWEFDGWSGDLAGLTNPTSILVDGPKTVTAAFSEIIYAFESDDFNACQLDPRWTFIDPLADGGSAVMQGAYTGDAGLAISTVGNTSHELWQGVISAPHVIQPALDVDFVAEVKFASRLPAEYFGQEGIIVKQDETNWLRLEFFSAGAISHIFAATPDGTTVSFFAAIGSNRPLSMRVTRTGDVWDLQWSDNNVIWNTPAGSGFTYPMNVTEIGLYAGNSGNNPAHTVLVDYFRHEAGPWASEDTGIAPITASVVGNGSVLKSPDLPNYGCAASVTLTAVGQPGWGFVGWSGGASGSLNPLTVAMDGPLDVTATFAPLAEYNLTVSAIGGGGTVSINPPTGPYYEGTNVILTAVDAPGWGYDAWSGDLTGSARVDTLLMDGDKNVTASFVAVPQFTLTASVPGGNGSLSLQPSGGIYNQGTPVIVAAVGDPGWGLDSWSGDLTGAANPDTLVMDADKTIAATFAPLPQYVLTVNQTGAGSVSTDPPGGVHFVGTAVALTATPDAGWAFDGWSGGLTGTANPDTIIIAGDTTVAAAFSKLPPVMASDDFNTCGLDAKWTVVDPFGDGGTAVVVNTFSDDAQVAISVPGVFEHEIWNGVIGATHILQPALDIDFVIEAKFDSNLPVSFAQEGILIKQDEGTWVRAEFFRDDQGLLRVAVDRGPALITHDVYLPPTATGPLWMRLERAGDTFIQSWSEDGTNWTVAGAPFPYSMNVTDVGLFAGNRGSQPLPHTVLVDYISNSAAAPAAEDSLRGSLTVDVAGGGLVTRDLDLTNYACGDVETLTAVDQPGWVFTGWTGDFTTTTNPLTVSMGGPVALQATFAAVPQYTVTAQVAGGNGVVTLDPSGPVFNAGTVVTVTASGDLGWGLSAWSGDLSGAATPVALVIDADKNFSALFTPKAQYGLSLAALGNGYVTAEPAQALYYDGDPVVLTANAAPGWLFGGWSGGLSGQANPDTLIMDATHSVTATFIELLTVAASDDFNACALDPVWTVVDPFLDGGTATLVNAYTDSARVAISVPGGSTHEIWDGVIGATHILQPAQDVDFVVEARFDSNLPVVFAQEGILIKQDETTWVRAEFFRDDANLLRVAVDRGPAQITHDVYLPPSVTAPLWMRIIRSGDTFTQYWSPDGTTWNLAGAPFAYEMTVTGMGLFAGNRGLNPLAHTVEVDYFSNTAGAPAAEDGATNMLNLTVAGSGSVSRALGTPIYNCGDLETLTAVPDPGWTFTGWSGDLTGTTNPADLQMDGQRNVTAVFQPVLAPNQVVVGSGPQACLSVATTCLAALPVNIVRNESTGLKSFSLTMTLTDLVLCGGVAGIAEGGYLNSVGATDFVVTDNLDGSFAISGTMVGVPCGATAANGTLFTLDLAAGVANGTGSVVLSDLVLRDCSDAALEAVTSGPGLIPIDTTVPSPTSGPVATPALSGNSSSGTIAIDLNWNTSAAPDVATTLVYRKAFGGFPEYSDAGGVVPTAPVDPVAEGWQLAATLAGSASAHRDLAPNRDYWYYHIVVLDACGNPAGSPVGVGGLNYLLADVAGGLGGNGDNAVTQLDVARLVASYGTVEVAPAYRDSLDIGPTTDLTIQGLPTTDNRIDFEDLMVFSLSFGLDRGPGGNWTPPASPPAGARDLLMLDIPAVPAIGQTFAVVVRFEGTGILQGLSLPLVWDNAVVTPVSAVGGSLLASQGGSSLTFMPQPGLIDLALLGVRERGIAGSGQLAVVTFEVVGPGAPAIDFGAALGRGQTNQMVDVFTGGVSAAPDLPLLPTVSALHQNAPNPFNPMTRIAFEVARAGRVQLRIYGIDGRLVRVLVDERLAPGRHDRDWNGRDDSGHQVASGVYLMRMATEDGVHTRRMTLLK